MECVSPTLLRRALTDLSTVTRGERFPHSTYAFRPTIGTRNNLDSSTCERQEEGRAMEAAAPWYARNQWMATLLLPCAGLRINATSGTISRNSAASSQ